MRAEMIANLPGCPSKRIAKYLTPSGHMQQGLRSLSKEILLQALKTFLAGSQYSGDKSLTG
jgi:hypothetical protein